MIISIRTRSKITNGRRADASRGAAAGLLLALVCFPPGAGRADTVASLLGNFTINQYCEIAPASAAIAVHYAVVFGQLPALRELHLADADRDGITTQAERAAYVGQLAPRIADSLLLRVDGIPVPLHAVRWTTSLPVEQGGFSLRVDVDYSGKLPESETGGGKHEVMFENRNYAGRMGWHEIVVNESPGLAVFDANVFSTSLTGALRNALASLPASGPLDERSAHFDFRNGDVPAGAKPLAARAEGRALDGVKGNAPSAVAAGSGERRWIARETRRLVDSISGPHLDAGVALSALLGALLLGAVHALSPGHGKTVVGAYLIGSRGTPRHAIFLSLTVTVTHTLGVFAVGLAALFASTLLAPERLFPILSFLSAALVLVMGIVLLVQRSRAAHTALRTRFDMPVAFEPLAPAGTRSGHGIFLVHSHAEGAMHSHGGGPMHSHLPPGAAGERVTWKSLLALGISGGLVPCPSAMVLLLAAVALNKTAYGMLLVVAFSLGLALTLTIVGLAFLYARNRIRQPTVGSRWPVLLPLLSAATITALGLALCLAALKSAGS